MSGVPGVTELPACLCTADSFRSLPSQNCSKPFSGRVGVCAKVSNAMRIADQTSTVTLSSPKDHEVIVTGTIRMTSPGIAIPASEAIFYNIFASRANTSSSGSGGGIGIGND